MDVFSFSGMASAIAAHCEARHARADAESANTNLRLLTYEVQRLEMILEALWTFIRENHDLTDLELLNRVNKIDMRDGKLDGRAASEPVPRCPHCGRTPLRKRPNCVYCGKALETGIFPD
jgi:hypothetical protein